MSGHPSPKRQQMPALGLNSSVAPTSPPAKTYSPHVSEVFCCIWQNTYFQSEQSTLICRYLELFQTPRASNIMLCNYYAQKASGGGVAGDRGRMQRAPSATKRASPGGNWRPGGSAWVLL